MINVLTLFPDSIEAELLDEFTAKAIHSFKQAQGFRSLKVSSGHLMSPAGPPPYARVIEAAFESLEVFMAWVQSQAAQAADKDQMIQNGVVMIFYEVEELGERSGNPGKNVKRTQKWG